MLSGKEKLLGQCRRMLRAYVPKKFADPITDVARLTGDTFTRFVTGQLIEACILGGAVHGGDAVHSRRTLRPPSSGSPSGPRPSSRWRGAYIGAIVSAVLLLMVSPLKALIFLVFLVILQQIEGNVIYPKVVGTSIGLPGIWVLAAVTVGGQPAGAGRGAAQRTHRLGAVHPAEAGRAQASERAEKRVKKVCRSAAHFFFVTGWRPGSSECGSPPGARVMQKALVGQLRALPRHGGAAVPGLDAQVGGPACGARSRRPAWASRGRTPPPPARSSGSPDAPDSDFRPRKIRVSRSSNQW